MRPAEGFLLGVATVLLLSFARQRPHFEEIDVERVNVVEKDGTLRMTLSNGARMPDPVIGGKSYPLRSGSKARAGIIFFNEEGNENGGLTFSGTSKGQDEALTFDQTNQDEAVRLGYSGRDHVHSAGLEIVDQPETSIQSFADSAMVIQAMPDGPDKTKRMTALRETARKGGQGGFSRVAAGKGHDKSSYVTLDDPQGRPRLELRVDSTGAASIDFLDANGHVTDHFPARHSR